MDDALCFGAMKLQGRESRWREKFLGPYGL